MLVCVCVFADTCKTKNMQLHHYISSSIKGLCKGRTGLLKGTLAGNISFKG